jgi:hypothetical protein
MPLATPGPRLLVAAGVALAPLLAAAGEPPHFVAKRTSVAPSIDGSLDDPAWRTAPATSAFTQKFPDAGAAPSERTTLRVLYDDKAIYVAFDCEQVHAPVVEHLSRRDRLVEADRVEIDLGSRHDRKSAFQFTVNAGGVLTDAVLFNDTDASSDWDENWEGRVARTAHGWSAELKIPLRILRFSSAASQSWDLEARRFVSERQEIDEWAFIPRDVAGEVSHYGVLDGLLGLRAGTPIELRPFILGRVRHRSAASTQLASGTDLSGSAGLDLKWHPTQSLTLDATLNPDFAQVEADQYVLNLTKFEIYYPEKRPFFLEGIDTFATPRQLLYTRRIGRAAPPPALRTSAPFGEQLVDVPSPATIYGASKITGEIADGWTIGTLQAITAENDVDVQLADRSRQKRLIDPMTAFNVLRVKRSLGSNGYVGAMFTATTHAEATGGYPIAPPGTTLGTPSSSNPGVLLFGNTPAGGSTQVCPDGSTVAPVARCFNDAYVGAVDWRWRSPGGAWVTGGQATATVLQNGPSRGVPDGTVIKSGDVGPGLFTYAKKEGGEHWVGDAQFEYEGRKLDYTDLGYNQRSNDYRWGLDIEWRDMKPWRSFLERHVRFEYFGRLNLDGLWLGSGYQLNASATFKNFWQVFAEVHWRPTSYDDREVGDGTALERAGIFGFELEASSNPAKPVSFTLQTQTQALYDGFIFNGTAGALFRALPQLDLEILPTAVYTFGEPRFVAAGALANQYVFGKLDAKSIGTTLRATYTFLPRLTLQAYAQLFLASGHYSDFSIFQAKGPGAVVHLGALRPYLGSLATNPDFEEGALNVNVVLRWEYTLGSTAFLVYTHSQVPATVLAPGEAANLNASAVSRAPAADVVLLKLTYFWAD